MEKSWRDKRWQHRLKRRIRYSAMLRVRMGKGRRKVLEKYSSAMVRAKKGMREEESSLYVKVAEDSRDVVFA